MRIGVHVIVCLLVNVTSTLSCGDDSVSEQMKLPLAGASGGTAGRGASAGTGAATGPVPCGTAMCDVPPQGRGVVKPCCSDPAASACGIMSGFTQNKCVAPAAPDPQCPSVMIVGTTAGGCCSPNGKCGVDASALGMGCVEFGSATAAMAGGSIQLPPPKDCVPGGAPVADAGAGDAG